MPRGDIPDHAAEYAGKTPASAKMFAESSKLHVNGVSHNIRRFDPYPFVSRSSEGGTITDVDGNAYTDYWMGHWSLVLGHCHPSVTRALHEQIGRGWMHGTVNEQAIRLSRMISDAVPAAEKIRYTASGTEAAMYAARLARSHTGRGVIAKVDGGWHGYASDLLKSVNWPFDRPESTGLVGGDKIVSVPYNDLDEAVRVLGEHAGDLAGIIVEPVLGGGGCIPASAEYMAGVQEFVHRNGSLFILDEIVTGFRLRYGCAYTAMSLEPDIITLGKIIGGGMPIGAVCGIDDVMAHADDSRGGRSYVGGGTFSANPAAMAAGGATLEYLRGNRGTYDAINGMGERVRSGLAGALGTGGGRAAITGIGSMFMAHFAKDGEECGDIVDAGQAALCDQEKLRRYHFKMIARDGIFVLPGKMGAVSAAHTPDDVERLVAASEEFAGAEQGR